jgi:hypothetical protein
MLYQYHNNNIHLEATEQADEAYFKGISKETLTLETVSEASTVEQFSQQSC